MGMGIVGCSMYRYLFSCTTPVVVVVRGGEGGADERERVCWVSCTGYLYGVRRGRGGMLIETD
jgi:hypothetical protein